ncbi:putative major facilitator superfamily protein [Lyophyllum shimeji]|uniref:Major facilitator superfamily protein n=1 Tax=Lyophyllum shimeji TaxID=47721 RepID=A0A9P3Q082_LYOSH|nr:putative major facilitator superfamily protein [Lyophyllum shimeji]
MALSTSSFSAAVFSDRLERWLRGPLLPAFQREYRLGYLIVSLYFVANCVGFILGGAFNVWFNDRIGFGKIMVIATIIQLAAYTIQPQASIPVMVAANFPDWFGAIPPKRPS